MSSLFLREDLGEATAGARISVVGAEAKHAVGANRIRLGETVSIGNGRGLIVTGGVVAASPSELVIEATAVIERQRPAPAIRLAQALAKGDRDELAIQASTELGVDGVIPWAAKRSVSRWDGAKREKGRDRWASIVREAAKQSIRAWVPETGELAGVRELAERAATERVLVLEPTADVPLSTLRTDGRDILLVVGPEGGIAPDELAAFVAAGAELVRLGENVLRTSSAGPAAMAVLNGILGRW